MRPWLLVAGSIKAAPASFSEQRRQPQTSSRTDASSHAPIYEFMRPAPFLDVWLFRRSRLFATANLAALANYVAFTAVTVLTSVFLEVVDGESPERAGLLLVAAPAAMVALSWLAGRTSDIVGSRWLASGGMAVVGVGLLTLSGLLASSSTPRLVGDLVLVGVGMAAFSSPNTSAVMGSVPRAQLGVASGILGTMRFLGQALSIAILGALATSRLGAGGQAVLLTGHARSTSAASGYAAGYRLAMLAGACIALAGAVASLTRPPVRRIPAIDSEETRPNPR